MNLETMIKEKKFSSTSIAVVGTFEEARALKSYKKVVIFNEDVYITYKYQDTFGELYSFRGEDLEDTDLLQTVSDLIDFIDEESSEYLDKTISDGTKMYSVYTDVPKKKDSLDLCSGIIDIFESFLQSKGFKAEKLPGRFVKKNTVLNKAPLLPILTGCSEAFYVCFT